MKWKNKNVPNHQPLIYTRKALPQFIDEMFVA